MSSSRTGGDVNMSKSLRIDDLHQKNKAASISAETFAQQQGSVHSTLNHHDERISNLSVEMKSLEQQVKAIARVMASQNVQKLSETMKLANDDLQRHLTQYVNDKNKEVMTYVESEVAEVTDAKGSLGKKIEQIESKLMSHVGSKLEEAAVMRHAMREEIERVKEMMENVPSIAEKNSKLISSLDAKIVDLKKEFRQFEVDHDSANIEQDKQVAAMMAEIRNSLESSREKLVDETKSLSKGMKKHETIMDEKLRSMQEAIEKEVKDREENSRSFPMLVVEKVSNAKADLEYKLQNLEADVERKVRPFMSAMQDVRHAIDEERVHREASDQELARNLAKEKKERDLDEEKLLSLISACQATVSKMHRSNA
eukprot:TRINITY_DN15043_c0_g3_i2.p1 TRINITY_DN15043_c0_g3~~TRINITY_DN15043_c0_g3_i2.p1  ORF type:complete len:369 (-),score=109.74 TRINITY_DN15043_c0_g3_i2:220-1326(-)